MAPVSTDISIDSATRDMLELIGRAKGIPVDALAGRAIAAFVERELGAIEAQLSDTLERVRGYRTSRGPGAVDPASTDGPFVMDPQESPVLVILDKA